ncbi:hypothetical protein [Lactiplantibacillus plantarum]|nr:hypothetical protein [Lactiplantibacillus plantarum]AGL64494.2 Glycosyltransferase (Putative) [Lactiplantibacillus plantarum subsp. plantarum P-8]KZT92413.1 hypothetical protein Nizo2258_2921 [Lactiplantibacillus plantarum]KZT96575.1 hypothetical protein Nizo2257_1691 [Lactiplantibacillus plantarum]MBR7568350.1 hypothetical protein [Lactiplantibacillus plantarum]MBR7623650.1 hypothetical protein [Lactiplantibacillus plantarum]
MMYWINLALTRMGFWITWALVPIVVEIIPAIMSTIKNVFGYFDIRFDFS